MKIAFTGTSGSGKTTLVHYVKETHNIPHLNGSSGELLTDRDKEYLYRISRSTVDQGHANVIKESHRNPEFGAAYQTMVLKRRKELMFSQDNFVTDRSPLDNFVYMILQAGLYQDDVFCGKFLADCEDAFLSLTHVIYVPAMLDFIEHNGSRISNYWYQQAVDAIFEKYWLHFNRTITRKNGPKVLVLGIRDLDERKSMVDKFLKEPPTI